MARASSLEICQQDANIWFKKVMDFILRPFIGNNLVSTCIYIDSAMLQYTGPPGKFRVGCSDYDSLFQREKDLRVLKGQ